MWNEEFENVAEKLEEAVGSLAGTGTIKERLLNAFLQLVVLNSDQLPEAIRGEFKQIEAALTCVSAKGDEGTAAATIDSLSEDDAKGLARRIIALYGDACRRAGVDEDV